MRATFGAPRVGGGLGRDQQPCARGPASLVSCAQKDRGRQARRPRPTARFPPMATAEVTGAEEVAWDLSDLFEGIDDPHIDEVVAQAEVDAAAFRERYHGKVAGLDPASLAEAVAEHERIEAAVVRPLTYAHLVFATNMADSARGALVARLGEKAAGARDAAPLLRARVGRRAGRRRRAPPGRPGARPLAPSSALAPKVPAVPALRARRARRYREDRLRRLRVVAALRGAAGCAPRRARRRRRFARDGARPPLRPRSRHPARRRRSDHRGARARAQDACVRLQHHPPGQVDRRPHARLSDLDLGRATSRTRRRTRRSTRSSRRRRRGTTSRSATTGSRPGCSGSTGSSTTTVRHRSRRTRGRSRGTTRGGSSSMRTASSRTRQARSSRASSTTTGSTGPFARTSEPVRFAPRRFRACTRTC